MKKILALVITLVMLSSIIGAFAEETVETTPAPEATVEATIEATVEATVEATAEIPAEEIIEETAEPEITEDDQLIAVIEDTQNVNRSVSIYASFSGNTLTYGDSVTLKAKLTGYDNVSYTLQWQVSKDNSNWQNVSGENGMEYSFTVTEDNASDYYRIAVSVEE